MQNETNKNVSINQPFSVSDLKIINHFYVFEGKVALHVPYYDLNFNLTCFKRALETHITIRMEIYFITSIRFLNHVASQIQKISFVR